MNQQIIQQDAVPQALAEKATSPWWGNAAPYLAEGIGTFGLVFAGCGAIVIDTLSQGQITHVGVSLVFGLMITVMIYALGHISGAHFNPAVTLGFVLVRHLPLRRLVGYWLAQCGGAILAAGCLRLLFGPVASLGATVPMGNGGGLAVVRPGNLAHLFSDVCHYGDGHGYPCCRASSGIGDWVDGCARSLICWSHQRGIDESCPFPGASPAQLDLD